MRGEGAAPPRCEAKSNKSAGEATRVETSLCKSTGFFFAIFYGCWYNRWKGMAKVMKRRL